MAGPRLGGDRVRRAGLEGVIFSDRWDGPVPGRLLHLGLILAALLAFALLQALTLIFSHETTAR